LKASCKVLALPPQEILAGYGSKGTTGGKDAVSPDAVFGVSPTHLE